MSPTQWIERTNSIGFIAKRGKYSRGTYVHKDIAFEFASWILEEFELYLIKEFQRLKEQEIKKSERIVLLNEMAKSQIKVLCENKTLKI